MGDTKFKFTTDFQYDLLRYIVQDSNGYKALEMVSDEYFTLIEHSVIAYTLKKYYKKKRNVPGKTILVQEILKTFNHRDFINTLTPANRDEILVLTKSLFEGDVQDGDDILENVEKFAQFVDLKNVIENIDLLDYSEYEPFSRKVQKAISPRVRTINERGSFLKKDIKDRQIGRLLDNPIVPTPFRGINRLTNAGGYAKGSILVVLDKAKRFKTGMLINIATGYQKQGKEVLVIDLDNGEGEFMIRVEQNIANLTKEEILSSVHDAEVAQKVANQKAEIVIKRMPSLITTANDIKDYMQYLYREFGFRPKVLIIDYIAKMGAISGKDSLHERIGDAYIDIGNLALDMEIEHVWTAQHVTREAAKKRMGTRYDSTDIAGAIDISRHVQAIFGLNRTTDEDNNNYQRLEIVDQRDGVPRGRAIFKIDRKRQRLKPLSTKQREEYYEMYKEHLERVDKLEIDDEAQPTRRANTYPGAKARKNDIEDV